MPDSFSEPRVCVVLTATVVPHPDVQTLVLRDPSERLGQYVTAVSRWATTCERRGWDLRVLENSRVLGEAQLQALTAAAGNGKVAHLPTTGADRNKGIGEAELLDHAWETGALDGADVLVKCTGRLFVPNAEACFPRFAAQGHLQTLLNSRLTSADARLFAISRDLWETYHLGWADLMRPRNETFESRLARSTLRALSDGAQLTRFPVLPRWVGRSGGHGDDYGSVRNNARRAVHGLVRAGAQRLHWAI